MIPALLLPLVTLFPIGQDATCVPDEVFPAASGDLVLVVDADGRSESLLSVVEEYARLTRQPVVVDPASQEYMRQQLTGLLEDVVVPPAGVQSFVEGMLANYGCSLVVRPGTPRSILIQTPRSEFRQWLREGALRVDEADLGAWRDHPATMIRCTVALDYGDARQVANSLRTELMDNTRQMLLPVGTERAITVTGGGRFVGDLVALIRSADESLRESSQSRYGRLVLSHAVAADVAPMLQELLDAASGGASGPQQQGPRPPVRVRAVADERTNSVLVLGTGEDLATARALVAELDVPVSAR